MIMTVAGARADATFAPRRTFARRRRRRAYHIARMREHVFIQGESNGDD